MKRSVITLLSVVAILLVSSAVSALDPPTTNFNGQIIDINYDSDTIGAQPSLGGGSPLITKPSDMGDYDNQPLPPDSPYGTILVGDVAGMSKAAVLTTNPNIGGYANVWHFNGINDVNTNQIGLKFDIAVMASPATLTQVGPYNLNGTSVYRLCALSLYEGRSQAYRSILVIPTSETGGVFGYSNSGIVTTFGSYVEGQKHTIAVTEDYTTGLASAYVDGVLGLSNFVTGRPLLPLGGWTREMYITMNGEAGYENQVAFDNFEAYSEGFLAGDANLDWTVNVADLTNLLNNYNKTEMEWKNGDFNNDHTVNVADLTALLNDYNKTSGGGLSMGSSEVPEPSSIAMLATIALTALLYWWRKRV
jgi:hypothetical protein